MNISKRLELIQKVKQQCGPDGQSARPVVSLEDFFTGNDDPGSIGCNTDNPGPEFFTEPLFVIRAMPTVQDVLVQITEVEEQDETMWPFSDRIYVLTSASQEEVSKWLAHLHPDTVEEHSSEDLPLALPRLNPGFCVYATWWD